MTSNQHFLGMTSLWTRATAFRLHRGALVVQTLSACLARKAFKETLLVTDQRGRKLARMLGWQYDHIDTSLEGFNPPGLSHIWALGKIEAMTMMQGPCIQFDGDVLLFKPLPAKMIGKPLIAQSMEGEAAYRGPVMDTAFELAGLRRDCPKYCAGIIGGSDTVVYREWACLALRRTKFFPGVPVEGSIASMVLEQASFGVYAVEHGIIPATLLPDQPSPEQVARAGYCHLQGPAKRQRLHVEACEKRLKWQFPGALEAFEAGWKRLSN